MAEDQALALSTSQPIYLASLPFTDLLGRGRTLSVTAIHKAVMSMFPAALPGDDSRRRESAGILYRIDEDNRDKTIIVQSHVPMSRATPGTRMRPVMGGIPVFDVGQAVRFRTTVNAVRKKRSKIVGAVPKDKLGTWVAQHAGLDGLEIIGHTRNISRVSREDERGFPVVVDTVEGVGSVVDPVLLARAMRDGIGRSRAFGCGLLTVVPLQLG